MKNIIGQPARGNDFYKREREVEKITTSLSNGNNIQITAPRRVGKTSILWFLYDNDIANRNYVYIDTESVSNAQDFYKKLLSEIVRNEKISESKNLRKSFSENKYFKKIKSITILNTGFELNQDEKEKDYFEELNNFLIGYASEEKRELIILVDEFPQTIENIKKTNEEDAKLFLQGNRALRINPDLKGIVKFIYTGSIGLNYTVSKLNATASINDLNSIEVGPLKDEEARDLFEILLKTNKRKPTEKGVKKLLDVLQWYIPFHIQLIVQEVVNQTKENEEVTDAVIMKAIDSMIDLRNQNHFDHYYSRLKSQFKDQSFKYADRVLKEIANKDVITESYLFDLSIPFELSNEYKSILHILVYDGYINMSGSKKEYRFNSPIVKLWWLKFIC